MKPSQQSPDFPDAFYRVSVKGLCVQEGKILMVHDFTGRSDTDQDPEWELPGGGLDFGEEIHEALRREVKEEMGLVVTSIEEKPVYIWTTKHEHSRKLDWYYVLNLVYRFDVADLNFTPTDECREIRFFSKEDLHAHKNELAPQILPLLTHFDPKDFV